MKKMNENEARTLNAGGGYKCSRCGERFYTSVIYRTAWWLPNVKSRAIDQCNMHIITAHRGQANARWCW